MKNGWRIIISIVLIVIILGGVCMGVGIITGADMDRVYSVLDRQYNLSALYKYVTEDLVLEFQRVGLM